MSFGFGFSLPAYAGYAASFGPSSFGSGTSLALDFLNGNNTLDPRITFSRTSNAMLTNSAGVLTYAPHNLLTFSEQFDNAAWTKNASATVTANSGVAPDGTTTADQLQGSLVNTGVWRVPTVTPSLPHVYSLYVKNVSNATALRIGCDANPANAFVSFNAVTGTITSAAANVTSSLVVDVGSGWYRVVIGFRPTTSAPSFIIYSTTGSDATWQLWGAQLNVGALQPYYPTTVKNLLGYTQEFDNAAWTKGDATVSTNTTVAPDGSVTADTITFGTNSTVPSQTVVITGGTPYTISFYVHASSTAPFVRIRASTAAGSVSAFYNVAAGVFGAMNAGFTPGLVVNEGNEWRRVSVQYVPLSPDGGARSMAVSATVADNSSTAATGSTLVLWGAQLSDSARLDPYVYNPVAAPASTAYYGPRFDYDPVTLAPKGLLVEEQRTNLSSNSVLASAWGAPSAASYTDTQALAPDGTNSAWRLTEDTTNAAHFGSMTSISTTYTSGTTYTVSRFLKAAGRTQVTVYLPGGAFPTSGRTAFFDLSSGTIVSTEAGVTASIQNVGNGWYRCTTTATANASVIAHVGGSALNGGIAYQGDGTSGVFIWGHQLEAGSFPTSYIPTTTAAATRAADVATMIGANFSSWYRQDEGTVFGEFTRLAAITSLYSGGFPRVAEISDGTTSNNLRLAGFSPAQEGFGVAVSGTDVCTLVFTQPASGTITKLAGTYKLNDFAASMNGSAAVNDTAGAIPAVSVMYIGNRSDGTRNMNGHIRRIAYYPRRLANTELQSITA